MFYTKSNLWVNYPFKNHTKGVIVMNIVMNKFYINLFFNSEELGTESQFQRFKLIPLQGLSSSRETI